MFDQSKKIEQGVKRSREGWFGRVARLFDRGLVDEQVWEELEELLILADVGVETTTKLMERVKQRVKTDKPAEASQIRSILKGEMVNMLSPNPLLSLEVGVNKSPQVILVAGVNGSGKTTSIAKLAYNFVFQGRSVILAACDTFRAAAIDQLKYWGKQIGAEVIAHQPGSDPGAVAFDAIQAAQSRHVDVVIVDTAGRLHTKFNLMEELKKVKRVTARYDAAAPHQVLLVIDATTGQNGLIQAKYFTRAIGVTGIFLAKLDGTAKGGIVLAICDELNIPISYIGTGEKLQDIASFDAEIFVDVIFS